MPASILRTLFFGSSGNTEYSCQRAGLPTLCTLLSFFISGTEDDGVTLAVVVMLTESTLACKIIINKKNKSVKPTLITSKRVYFSESYV